MRLQTLFEALQPSQYRNLVVGWDKNRYRELFMSYPNRDRNGYRIYLPFEVALSARNELEEFVQLRLEDNGYELVDYIAGTAKDSHGRIVKIGKVLAKLGRTTLLDRFTNDPRRAGSKTEQYKIVISRHPYDIAGMSTGRGWTSCMNLRDGSNRRYVPIDIKEGTIVAYLIKPSDTNIQRPTARILIKPFVNIESPSEVAFGVEDRVYGENIPGFAETVAKWANNINQAKGLDGIFKLNPRLYNDSSLNYRVISDTKLSTSEIREIVYDGRDLDQYDYRVQMQVLMQFPSEALRIKDPSPELVAMLAMHGTARAVTVAKNFVENKPSARDVSIVNRGLEHALTVYTSEFPNYDTILEVAVALAESNVLTSQKALIEVYAYRPELLELNSAATPEVVAAAARRNWRVVRAIPRDRADLAANEKVQREAVLNVYDRYHNIDVSNIPWKDPAEVYERLAYSLGEHIHPSTEELIKHCAKESSAAWNKAVEEQDRYAAQFQI